jgi:hypothetical protein
MEYLLGCISRSVASFFDQRVRADLPSKGKRLPASKRELSLARNLPGVPVKHCGGVLRENRPDFAGLERPLGV